MSIDAQGTKREGDARLAKFFKHANESALATMKEVRHLSDTDHAELLRLHDALETASG
jgi:hypothetical protein